MNTPLERSRDTWSDDGRYLIRSKARWISVAQGLPHIKAGVQIFDGNPDKNGKPAIFESPARGSFNDLWDAIQNGERIGREYIAALK